MKNERIKWIDIAKAFAILAVILDHMYGIIYKNDVFHLHTAYSVTLFVFLGGITANISIGNKQQLKQNYVVKKVLNLLIPYFFATFISIVYLNNWILDVGYFFKKLLTFSAQPPFYFILFYAQLILISTILYIVIKECNKNIIKEISILFLIYLFSRWLTHYSFIYNVYGGGGKLFGGSYLFVYFLGMLFYEHIDSLKDKLLNVIILICSIVGIAIMEVTSLINKIWSNPPNKFLLMYTLCIFLIIFSINNIFTLKNKISIICRDFAAFVGKNTLYIFLYHWLFLYIGQKLNMFKIHNVYLNVIWALIWALVPPIIISLVTSKIKKSIKKVYYKYFKINEAGNGNNKEVMECIK